MTYEVRILKYFFGTRDYLLRIREAERLKNVMPTSLILVFLSALIYGWMASLGMGSNLIAAEISLLEPATFESSKLWFVIGRVAYGLIFAVIILFLPSLMFYTFTDIPFKKLVHMQQIVLFVLLLERLMWIPLATFAGLDWYSSPLSFGIIASYLTENGWFIYFFGAITLFQIWIMFFQYRFMKVMGNTRTALTITVIVLLQLVGWAIAATLALGDALIIGWWFE